METTAAARFTTESSIWTIDTDSMHATRLPRCEDPSHPSLPYAVVGHPHAITGAHIIWRHGGRRLCVHGHPSGGPLHSGILIEGPEIFDIGHFDCNF